MGKVEKPGGQETAGARQERKGAGLTGQVVDAFESKLTDRNSKANSGDAVRLLQIHKELQEKQPGEISVTWVESLEKEDVPVA